VKNVGVCWKGPKNFFLKNEGHQKNLMDAKDVHVLIIEN
jgi:hypothetical protein